MAQKLVRLYCQFYLTNYPNMKTLLFAFVLIFALQGAYSQPTRSAVLLKNRLGYSKGDTLLLTGYFPKASNSSEKYVVKSARGEIRQIKPAHIRVIDTIDNFWDSQWYYYSSGKAAKNGMNTGLRKKLNEDYNGYLAELKNNNFLFENPETMDYLEQLIRRIGPEKLYKGTDAKLSIHVIKTDTPDIFSFDNGAIFITTGLLANTSSETELVKLLSAEVGHIVGDHQFINRKNENLLTALVVGAIVVTTVAIIAANSDDSDHHNRRRHHQDNNFNLFIEGSFLLSNHNFSPPPVAFSRPARLSSYNKHQVASAATISNVYMASEYEKTEHPSVSEYCSNISGAITYSAWNAYFDSDYKKSLALVNRLENNGAAGSDDFLLKSKLYRKLYNTDEARYEALQYVQKAREMSNTTNVDILKEEGLIYFQLEQKDKARSCFEEYRYGLKQLGQNDENDRREIAWVDQMIQKTM